MGTWPRYECRWELGQDADTLLALSRAAQLATGPMDRVYICTNDEDDGENDDDDDNEHSLLRALSVEVYSVEVHSSQPALADEVHSSQRALTDEVH